MAKPSKTARYFISPKLPQAASEVQFTQTPHRISGKTVTHSASLSNRTWGWGLSLICLTAFLVTALLAHTVFEQVPHSEDETAYIFQAKIFAQSRLFVPTPPNDRAFWTPFVVDYEGRRFGKYSPGWPLLFSVGVRLGAPWLVNSLLAATTLGLIGWLGRKLYGNTIGLVAAGLGLVTPGLLLLSGSMLSHPASLFWSTVALVTTGYWPGPRGRLFALISGLALGLAFITRPFTALSVGLPLGVYALALLSRKQAPAATIIWLGIGAALTAGLLPLYWWRVTGNPAFNAYLLVWPYDRIGFGPDIGPHGYTLIDAIVINTRLKLLTLATGLFGWPGWTNLLFLPVPFIAPKAKREDWLLLGIIGSIVGVHIFYWAFGGADGGFPRYYYDALPAFLLLTARGIVLSGQMLTRWISKGWPGWLPGTLAIAFVVYNLAWTLPPLLHQQKGKYGITPHPLQAVTQANLTEPALVLVKNFDLWSDFAAPFAANSPTLDGPVVYAIDWGTESNRWLQAQFPDRQCWELDDSLLTPCP
jgi:hypothetical protein